MQKTTNAGFLKRIGAMLLDCSIYFVIITIPLCFIMLGFSSEMPVLTTLNAVAYVFVVFFLGGVLHLVYAVYFISNLGGTLGKLAFGLRIVDQKTGKYIDKKTAFYRAFAGYTFSSQLFGLGYLQILRNTKNLAWHDELFNTKVVTKASPILGVGLLIISSIMFVILVGFILTSLVTSPALNTIFQ